MPGLKLKLDLRRIVSYFIVQVKKSFLSNCVQRVKENCYAAVHPIWPLCPRRLHHSLHAAHRSRRQEWSPSEASHFDKVSLCLCHGRSKVMVLFALFSMNNGTRANVPLVSYATMADIWFEVDSIIA